MSARPVQTGVAGAPGVAVSQPRVAQPRKRRFVAEAITAVVLIILPFVVPHLGFAPNTVKVTTQTQGDDAPATDEVVTVEVVEAAGGTYELAFRATPGTGTFTLTRVGDVKMLSTDGPTPNEKAAEAARDALQRAIEEGLDIGEEP